MESNLAQLAQHFESLASGRQSPVVQTGGAARGEDEDNDVEATKTKDGAEIVAMQSALGASVDGGVGEAGKAKDALSNICTCIKDTFAILPTFTIPGLGCAVPCALASRAPALAANSSADILSAIVMS